MDNHPEIEARWAEKRGLVTLARLFRAIDVWSLNRMTAIITLDEAMASVCRNLAPGVPLVVHPTWGKTVSLDGSRMTGLHRDAKSPLRLAYAGNLGASHGTEVLHRLLRALSNRHPLNLAFIGVARTSEGTVKTLADNVKADLTILPRTPFEKLGELFQSMSSDMGIVLMKDSAAGVLSPSKFSGYIAHGLPFIYIGPDGTNAALVVDRFGAGIRLSNDANEEEITSAAARILDIREREFWRQNSLIAKNYFDSKNAQSLALEILPFFESGNNH